MKFKPGIALLTPVMLMTLAAPLSQAAAQQTSKEQAGKQAAQHSAADHKTAEAGEVERITVEELKAKIEKNEPVTILDVRSEGSYESSDKKVKGAVRMLTDEIEPRLKEIPKDRVVVTYCT